jgi:hypothetical protein
VYRQIPSGIPVEMVFRGLYHYTQFTPISLAVLIQPRWDIINNFQNQLETYLTTSLRHHLQQNLSLIYRKALRYVRKKTQNAVIFPDRCPYSLDYLLNSD